MTKIELIELIKSTFKNITLDDGIGLWETQGLGDYTNEATLKELRARDERKDWRAIPYADLSDCESSLSFFDAEGMLFHLPQFLLYNLEDKNNSVDLTFTLTYQLKSKYQTERFSLFKKAHSYCIVCYLEYKLQLIVRKCKAYEKNNETVCSPEDYDSSFTPIENALTFWKRKARMK